MQDVTGRRTVEIVTHVVFPGPDDLHGRAGIAGDEGRFDGVVLNQAADKASLDKRDVHFDALARNTQRSGHGFRASPWNLRRRPELALAIADVGRTVHRL